MLEEEWGWVEWREGKRGKGEMTDVSQVRLGEAEGTAVLVVLCCAVPGTGHETLPCFDML